MALPHNDSYDNLERLRQSLQRNIDQLRKSLQYWRTWEYEYEGLKEEIERSDLEPSAAEMLAVGKSLELDLIGEQEVKDLLNFGKTPPRSRAKVISQINGRIDTGQRNATTVQKQLAAAEEKLEKVLIVQEPLFEGDNGEALMDIVEELDEGDNVVSSSVVNADNDCEMLDKVMSGGVFPSKTDVATQAKAAKDKEKEAQAGKHTHPTQRMLILDDNDNIIDSEPLVLMSKRSEDEAIDHMREARTNAAAIAPIVATFDIEEASDDDNADDDDDDEYSEMEDEFGMSDIGAEITDEYHEQMEALMQKHTIALENAGPGLNQEVLRKLENAHRDVGFTVLSNVHHEDKRPYLHHTPKASAMKGEAAKKVSGKGVRFAEELVDFASTSAASGAAMVAQEPEPAAVDESTNPIAEAVVERFGMPHSTIATLKASVRKPSRFKTSMNTTNNATRRDTNVNMISGEPPAIISSSLSERPKKVSRFKASKMES